MLPKTLILIRIIIQSSMVIKEDLYFGVPFTISIASKPTKSFFVIYIKL